MPDLFHELHEIGGQKVLSRCVGKHDTFVQSVIVSLLNCTNVMVIGCILRRNKFKGGIGINIGSKESTLVGVIHEHIHNAPGGSIDPSSLVCVFDSYMIAFLKKSSVCGCLHIYIILTVLFQLHFLLTMVDGPSISVGYHWRTRGRYQ